MKVPNMTAIATIHGLICGTAGAGVSDMTAAAAGLPW
jgi:hypothetical protein